MPTFLYRCSAVPVYAHKKLNGLFGGNPGKIVKEVFF